MNLRKLIQLTALALATLAPAFATANEHTLIWACSTNEEQQVEVFAPRAVDTDHFGRLELTLGEPLVVRIAKSGVSHDFSALVLRVDNSGGITKHGTMARYTLARGTLPRTLHLNLGGIDEFRNRNGCEFSDQK